MSWSQLSAIYEVPTWDADAKLGLWPHWGRDAYSYHNERFGHPSKVGYKDILHQWRTPKLDTEALMK